MKFLVITGSLYNHLGGPFLSVRSLVKAFLSHGHQVTVFGSKDENSQNITPESYRSLLSEFTHLRVYALNKYGPYHLHFTPELSKYLHREQEEYDAILIQGVWMWNCWRGFWFGYKKKIPTIISIRGEFVDAKSMSALKKKPFLPWVFYMLNRCTTIHVLNTNEVNAVRSFNINSKCVIIPNGVFLPASCNYASNAKNILYLGRLHPDKNLIAMVKAWQQLDNKLGWKLTIAGGGEKSFETNLRNEINDDLSIELIGPVDEQGKTEVFKQASWFILPSLMEGMPMAALEAMSHGIPCLLSRECNLNEFIDSNAAIETGLEINSIKNAFEKAINSDANTLLIMSKKGLEIIQAKYSWDLVVKQFESSVEELSGNLSTYVNA